jgi:hypothetical protein
MRIIKLSSKDPAMRTEADVREFFEDYLPHEASPPGRFQLTRGRIAEDGLSIGEKLVFSYQSKLVYLGHAASGVAPNAEPDNGESPSFFLVDAQRIYRARGTLRDFEDALREKGLLQKNIVKSQGWPTLEDSPELDKIWQSFRAV